MENIKDQFLGFLATPSLWLNDELFNIEQFKIAYEPLNVNFSANTIAEIETRTVLGKRMEYFFEYILKNSENYKLLVANQQIFANKITLGEIDFIIADKNRLVHIELVYKFYVYDPNLDNELERWIGPNRKDSLLEKITKLKEKQLPLLFKPETISVLKEKGIDPIKVTQKVCYKASLFIPKNRIGQQFPFINNSCIFGYWISFSDFTHKDYGSSQFYSPQKKDWPIDPSKNSKWLSFQKIFPQIDSFIQEKRAPLIWMKTKNTFEGFFIVWW